MIKEITIPEIGENVDSGDVVGVLVSEGDIIDADQGVIEVETEKAVVEIPSPAKGEIVEISVGVGDSVKVGQVIGKIDTESVKESSDTYSLKETGQTEKPKTDKKENTEDIEKDERVVKGTVKSETPAAVEATKNDEQEEEKKPKKKETISESQKQPDRHESIPAPASPSVRRLARELGADIENINGSGPGGRITQEDVKEYVRSTVKGGKPQPKAAETVASSGQRPIPDFSKWGEIETEPLSKVRRITAENVSYSWNVAPHVTQFDEADVTWFDEFRKKYSKEVEKAGGKLTLTAVIIKTIAAALKRYPKFNSTIDTDKGELIYKKYFNIGIAADTDRGLLVPVLRDADEKGVKQIAVEMTDLAERARNKRIDPDEMEGGTFTISNQGAIGGVQFTPIILWPQVAILGVSRSSIKPKYIDGDWKPRMILPLSLSYDHRVIDGAEAARFLKWVAEALEHPLVLDFD